MKPKSNGECSSATKKYRKAKPKPIYTVESTGKAGSLVIKFKLLKGPLPESKRARATVQENGNGNRPRLLLKIKKTKSMPSGKIAKATMITGRVCQTEGILPIDDKPQKMLNVQYVRGASSEVGGRCAVRNHHQGNIVINCGASQETKVPPLRVQLIGRMSPEAASSDDSNDI